MHQRVEAFLVRGQWPERIAFDRTLVYGTACGAAGELRSIANIPAGTTDMTLTCGNWIGPLMSALGQKQTSAHVRVMSALPPKADIGTHSRDVCFVPKGDKPHRSN
jgi:hypothetical protein